MHSTVASRSIISQRFAFTASWSEEPYRVFFPLGIVVGIVGVGLWPLWYAGWLGIYPGPAHVRLMIEGFFTAFIFGFVGTAGPRMLDVRALSPAEWLAIGGVWGSGQLASVLGAHNWAEATFALALSLFLIALGRRAPGRDGLPPPGFALVGASLLIAIPAALSQMPVLQRSLPELPVWVWLAGRGYLVETFILLPVLGAMPFFFGRFGGLPPVHPSGETRNPDRRWLRQAAICGLLGLGLLAALLLKASGSPRLGALLQASATAAFILTQVPWRYPSPVPTLARIAQVAAVCIPLAALLEALMPGERLAWRHLLMIPGFQGVVVVVGSWVVFAHAGRRERLRRRWWGLGLCAAGWAIAAVSRMAAEWLPAIYQSHLIYAAVLWIGASLSWLWILLPRLREDG